MELRAGRQVWVLWASLSLFQPQFPCLENVVNSSYCAGRLLTPGAEGTSRSHAAAMEAEATPFGGHPMRHPGPDRIRR